MHPHYAAIAVLFALCASLHAGGADRYVQKHRLPGGRVAVVAEGDLEPRSIGSYSVRIYTGRSERFPTDDFVCGLIRERDGSVEAVNLADIDGDGTAEIVVILRCVGTGGYLSADALSVKGGQLRLVAHAEGLPKDADSVRALSAAAKKR